jgi:hypothetical protein
MPRIGRAYSGRAAAQQGFAQPHAFSGPERQTGLKPEQTSRIWHQNAGNFAVFSAA